jgi:ribosome biogenesis GTPase / thiamine phosphate phosphatase
VDDLADYGATTAVWSAYAQTATAQQHLARIAAVHYGGLFVRLASGLQLAEPVRALRKRMSADNYRLVVGDWVVVEAPEQDGRYAITEQLPRMSVLTRKAAGEAPIPQAMCANVDRALLVTSLNSDFSVQRLARYAAIAAEGGVAFSIVLTKADLAEPAVAERAMGEARALCNSVYVTSLENGNGLAELDQLLEPRRTFVMLGSSGVGKSSLLNRWGNTSLSAVGAARESDGKGRHTTTHRELFLLPNGAVMIDTPGMREVALHASEDDDAPKRDTFPDVLELALGCKFTTCLHLQEPSCAVRTAVSVNMLPASRLDAYRALVSTQPEATRNAFIAQRRPKK